MFESAKIAVCHLSVINYLLPLPHRNLTNRNQNIKNNKTMDANQINIFLASKGDYFPSESIPMIRERLEHLDPQYGLAATSIDYLNPIVNLIVSIFVGEFGVDRFLIGQTGLGIGKLLLFLCCGSGLVWWIVDLFLIMGATKQRNLEKFLMAVGG